MGFTLTYLSLSSSQDIPSQTISAVGFTQGNSLSYIPSRVPEEIPMNGGDIEIGHSLPFTNDKARLFAGGFYFYDKSGKATNIKGTRFRGYYDVTDWLRIGGEVQYDNVRDDTAFADIRFRIPLQKFIGKKKTKKLTGIYARMDKTIIRDIDIVSQSVTPAAKPAVPLINAATGVQQNIIFVDNTNGAGTGTSENPFNTLAVAEAAAGANDVIYVRKGDGTSTGMVGTINLDDTGQMLIGSGSGLVFDSNYFIQNAAIDDGMVLIEPSAFPLIDNAVGDNVIITADNVLVKGVKLDSPVVNGIAITNANNITIDNVIVDSPFTGSGISINDSDFVTVKNSQLMGAVFGDGINAAYNAGPKTYNLTIVNNIIKNNLSDNIEVNNYSSNTLNAVVSNNIISGAVVSRGIFFRGFNTSQNNLTITNNIVTANNANGININQTNDSIVTVLVEGNQATSNLGRGVNINSQGTSTGGSLTAVVRNNVINNNAVAGLRLNIAGLGDVSTLVEGNTITNNLDGILITDTGAGSVVTDFGNGALGSIGNNRIFDNTGFDLSLDGDGVSIGSENNWWGSSNGISNNDINLVDGTSVDTNPFLLSDPEE